MTNPPPPNNPGENTPPADETIRVPSWKPGTPPLGGPPPAPGTPPPGQSAPPPQAPAAPPPPAWAPPAPSAPSGQPAGYPQPPQQGGYQQPGQPPQGYGQPYQQPGGGYQQPAPVRSGSSINLASINPLDWGILGAGLLALIFSFLGYYSIKLSNEGQSRSDTYSAWHGFFGWFGVLLVLLGAAVVALSLFVPSLKLPLPSRLVGLGLAALGTLFVLLSLFIHPGTACIAGSCGSVDEAKKLGVKVDQGPGWALWIVLILAIATVVLMVLRFTQTGGQLPGLGGSGNSGGAHSGSGGHGQGYGQQQSGFGQPQQGYTPPPQPGYAPPPQQGYAPPPPGGQPGYAPPPPAQPGYNPPPSQGYTPPPPGQPGLPPQPPQAPPSWGPPQ